MEQDYLIDSNAVIDYLAQRIPVSGSLVLMSIINRIPNISVINKIEILGFKSSAANNKVLVDFVNDCRVFDLSDEIVRKTIQIRKIHKTKLPDAIIAATALVNDFTLVTRNVYDFKEISGLRLFNPYE